MELLVATKNKKKFEEIRRIWKGLGFEFSSLSDCPDAPRIIENGKSFKENAVKKAVKIAAYSKKLTLGEDSGLCVDALDGRPGIYSSRFAGKGKSDDKNNFKLLKLLGDLPQAKRKAHYVCAAALADKDGLIGVVEGKCHGYIGFTPMGTAGFGYDPLFVIPRYKKTFAQLGERIKHKMSHRFLALKKAEKTVRKYIERKNGN